VTYDKDYGPRRRPTRKDTDHVLYENPIDSTWDWEAIFREVDRVTQSGRTKFRRTPITPKERAVLAPVLAVMWEEDSVLLTPQERTVLSYYVTSNPVLAGECWRQEWYGELLLYIHHSPEEAPTQEEMSHWVHVRQPTVSKRLTLALKKLSELPGILVTRENIHRVVFDSIAKLASGGTLLHLPKLGSGQPRPLLGAVKEAS
jgi:hypothetical protein